MMIIFHVTLFRRNVYLYLFFLFNVFDNIVLFFLLLYLCVTLVIGLVFILTYVINIEYRVTCMYFFRSLINNKHLIFSVYYYLFLLFYFFQLVYIIKILRYLTIEQILFILFILYNIETVMLLLKCKELNFLFKIKICFNARALLFYEYLND